MIKSTIHKLRRRPLALALSVLLLGGVMSQHAAAQAFPAVINLSGLNGSNGFRMDGEAAGDSFGRSVSAAGDINGDGRGDLIVGAPLADPSGNFSGSSYVVFGKTRPFAATMALSSLNGSNGFRLDGVAASDNSGYAVRGAGDINGDGLDDLIVGAIYAGSSYVVFGKATPFAASLALSSLNGTNGVRIDNATAGLLGHSVSSAGDINGDGFDDLIVGAPRADLNGYNTGSSYVVFGRATPVAATLTLLSLDGTNGFRIDGAAADDKSGFSVNAAGDFNGDGLDDLIVGAYGADSNGFSSGSSYLVFGRATPFAATLALSGLDGTNGFRIDGEARGDYAGMSVSAAGDINGDGRGDLIVGAPYADPKVSLSGSSYVVFGQSAPNAATLALSSLNGANGFRLDGASAIDIAGLSVSGAGDINGDGVGDLIIGAPGADPNGSQSGSSYVVFGKVTPFAATMALSALNGANGFRVDGLGAYDRSGISVSAAGDINGDGRDDLIIGATGAGPNGNVSGSSYVVFGRDAGAIFMNGFE